MQSRLKCNDWLALAIILLETVAYSNVALASEPAKPAVTQNKALVGMILIPAGDYRPFFKRADGQQSMPVAAFYIDVAPVTKLQFLDFVRRNPTWRRSEAKALVAEANYLADWSEDLDPGGNVNGPVTFVSWSAARAFCSERGRLPTVAEWERVAGERLDLQKPDDISHHYTPFQFAMGTVASDLRRLPLQFGTVWEWTEDFNSAPALSGAQTGSGDGPLFCGDGYRSNDATDYAAFLRHSLRSSLRASYTLKNLGFRCAH